MPNDMNLTLPTVSTTPGPLWATEINTALNTISDHNHTFGNGALIPSAALDINADLSFAGNRATNLGGSLYTNLTATPTFTNGVYCRSGNLYFRDGAGNEIPITSGGNVVGSAGTITGMSGTTAAATYDVGSGAFIFTQNTNQAASFDVGPITVRRTTASSDGVTITPASGTTNWTLTLPSDVPAANSFVTATTGGALGYVSQTGGITGGMIAGTTITGSNIASATITNNKLAALNTGPSASGSGSTSSASFTQIGNTATITTVGRGSSSTIAYVLQSINGTNLGSIELKDTVDSLVSAELQMSIIDVSTSTEYFHNRQSIIAPILATPGRFFRYPLSSYSGVFQIGFSGQFELKMKARVTSATGTVSIYNFQIFAYEL